MKKKTFMLLACLAFTGSIIASNEMKAQNPSQKIEKITSNRICSDQWQCDYKYYLSLGYGKKKAEKRANKNQKMKLIMNNLV